MIGYVRSDKEAEIVGQRVRLKAAGASRIIIEPRRCGSALAPELDSLFGDLRPGDLLAIDNLLSLGADLRDVFERLAVLRSVGAHLIVLDKQLDTRRALSLFDAAAVFAQVQAQAGPRLPFHQTDDWQATRREIKAGTITADEAAIRHQVSRATIYRHLD